MTGEKAELPVLSAPIKGSCHIFHLSPPSTPLCSKNPKPAEPHKSVQWERVYAIRPQQPLYQFLLLTYFKSTFP